MPRRLRRLRPAHPSAGLTQSKIIDNLRSNWYNGTDLASQKAIAKSLIKQGLTSANAAALANVVGVDPGILQSVATKISSGTALAANETDVFSRLDFILTALLDDAYQDASQSYTNGTRLLASFFAILLALVAGWTLHGGNLLGYADPKGQWIAGYLNSQDQWLAILVGILATPLAPIAKDLSSALSTAVNTLQSVKK